jgi:hypothetical protein
MFNTEGSDRRLAYFVAVERTGMNSNQATIDFSWVAGWGEGISVFLDFGAGVRGGFTGTYLSFLGTEDREKADVA